MSCPLYGTRFAIACHMERCSLEEQELGLKLEGGGGGGVRGTVTALGS